MLIRTLILLLAGALAPASGALAQEAQEGLGVRLVEAPESRRDDPRARTYIVDHVAPGTTFSRRIEVSNGTGRDVAVDLYAAAARIEEGAFTVLPGRAENELTEWITVEPTEMALADGARRHATVTVAVPESAESGEYYGAVLVELPARTNEEGVSVTGRVGIRIYLSVGTGAEPETDFELRTFQPIRTRQGQPGVTIDSCNTGGRALDLVGELELEDGPGGTSAGPFRTERATTFLPGQCEELTILMDPELPRGPWDATATLRSGETEKSAEAEITFPEEAGEQGRKVEAKEVTGTTGGRVALAVALLLLLLALGLLLFFFLRRRGRSDEERDEPPRA